MIDDHDDGARHMCLRHRVGKERVDPRLDLGLVERRGRRRRRSTIAPGNARLPRQQIHNPRQQVRIRSSRREPETKGPGRPLPCTNGQKCLFKVKPIVRGRIRTHWSEPVSLSDALSSPFVPVILSAKAVTSQLSPTMPARRLSCAVAGAHTIGRIVHVGICLGRVEQVRTQPPLRLPLKIGNVYCAPSEVLYFGTKGSVSPLAAAAPGVTESSCASS